ncbi:MAG: IS4 family transposase [Bacteroidia bacterium]
MKSKKVRPTRKQTYKKIGDNFKQIDFNKLARKSEFKKRKEKKLKGKNLVLGFMLMSMYGTNTFAQWAQEVGWINGKTISKQAVCKRITGCFVAFVLLILNEVFTQHVKEVSNKVKRMNKLKTYKNILVQDSTLIQLPQCLSKFYPGNYSRGEIKASIRIQLIIELHRNKIVQFQVTPYSKNDQSMSSLIFDVARKGDLIIRDLGYFVMDVFEKMIEASMKFITRIKPGVKIYDSQTGVEINLVKLLGNRPKLDLLVTVSTKNKLPLRLVAIKLPDEVANEKIRKEKRNRNKRLNHSKEYYELMRYTIYLTSEPVTELNAQDVAKIYNLRWRIENIFKTWKSNLHLQKLIASNISMSKARAESIIYLMLIFILEFQMKIYNDVVALLRQRKESLQISITKFSKFIAINFNDIF